ncbi:MAG TPA: cupin domain-containing protein [Smithellaceae bacterium]|nr:cupin domain-containing protein [Smithellaceae bacterium]
MKIMPYSEIKATHVDNDVARGVAGRVLVGKSDGADNFCMRIFEIAPGGYTPRHTHNWEHEMFIHAGAGEIYGQGRWHSVATGSVIFMPANEEHQIKNTGTDLLKVVCIVPSQAPEL